MIPTHDMCSCAFSLPSPVTTIINSHPSYYLGNSDIVFGVLYLYTICVGGENGHLPLIYKLCSKISLF